MNRVFLLLLSSLLLVTGCKSKPKPVEPTGKATLVGMIEMVNPEQNYVLIRCEPLQSIPAGTELIALSSTGAKSKLVLTPEKKGYYLTADIKEGNPQVHHLVLLQRTETPAAVTPPPAPAPVTPAVTGSSSSPYQPMPFLPGFVPGTGAGDGTPSAGTAPQAAPEPPAPAAPKPKAPPLTPDPLGGLEPPVGNP